MTRKVLPNRRYAESFHIDFWGQGWEITIGYYDPKQREPAEIFVNGGKSGVTTESVSRDGAILLSLCLQHNVPLDVIKHALTRDSGDNPSTLFGLVVDRLYEERQKKENTDTT